MRQETQGVTETLIKNATEEFLEYGFTKASLRRIAGSSGVSTNSIYTRFKDKEGLFLESIQKAKESTNLDHACLEGGQGTNFVLDYVYQHLQEFKLIFCCSAGTEYEDYLDRLGEIEESYYLEFVRKYGQDKMTVDPFFIHVFCRAGWQTIYEVVMHNRTYKEAQSFMDSTVLFNRAGWKAVMGIEK